MVEDMDFNSLLIQQVKQYPVLYDNTSVNYKDNFKKAQAWTSVSDEVGDSVVTCQQRWKILRERYVREKKLLDMPWTSSNFCHTVTKHPWPHMDQMCFLSSYIKHRNRSFKSAADLPEVVLQEDSEDLLINCDDNHDDTSHSFCGSPMKQEKRNNDCVVMNDCIDSTDIYTSTPYVTKRKKWDGDCSTSMNIHATLNLMSVDEDDLFCLSLATTLKSLPSQTKSLTKLQIMQLLHSMKFPDDGVPQAHPSEKRSLSSHTDTSSESNNSRTRTVDSSSH